MEPEFTCPALQEHGLFFDTLTELEEYLEAVLGFKKDPKGSPIPDPTKKKIPYNRNKIIELFDKLVPPLFEHVSSPSTSPVTSPCESYSPGLNTSSPKRSDTWTQLNSGHQAFQSRG